MKNLCKLFIILGFLQVSYAQSDFVVDIEGIFPGWVYVNNVYQGKTPCKISAEEGDLITFRDISFIYSSKTIPANTKEMYFSSTNKTFLVNDQVFGIVLRDPLWDFTKFRDIQFVALYNVPLTDELVAKLQRLDSLRFLKIVADESLYKHNLAKLSQITHLAISAKTISSELLGQISRLNLKYLEIPISENLQNFDASALKHLSILSLKEESLEDKIITNQSVANISQIPKLENVKIYSGKFEEETNAWEKWKFLKIFETSLSIDGDDWQKISKWKNLSALSFFSSTSWEQIFLQLSHLQNLKYVYAKFNRTKWNDEAWINLAKCEALVSIEVEGYEIDDKKAILIKELKNLRVLSLNFSKHFNVEYLQNVFRHLPNLEILEIPRAKIQLNCLQGLSSVRYLNIQRGKISGKDLGLIKHMKQLRYLDLMANIIQDEDLEQLNHFPNLTHVNLRATKIQGTGFRFLKTHGLRNIYLSSCTIKDASIHYISQLPNLRSLDLANTSTSDNGINFLANNNKIVAIDLSYTRVTNKSIEILSSFKKLKHLFLEGYVNDNNMIFFTQTKLTVLSLSCTQISNNALSFLEKLESLGYLNLSYTSITENEIVEFQTKLPYCECE